MFAFYMDAHPLRIEKVPERLLKSHFPCGGGTFAKCVLQVRLPKKGVFESCVVGSLKPGHSSNAHLIASSPQLQPQDPLLSSAEGLYQQ